MPQELHVLRCYSCKMYQVQIVKKTNKWQCKICNEKQSVQAVFFRGSGSECRSFVQEQNFQSSESKEIANFHTGVVEAWGLDCEADGDPDELCSCARKRTMVETLSRCVGGSEKNFDKENLRLSQNPEKRRRIEATNRFFSQPSSLTLYQDSQGGDFARERKPTSSGKWDKFADRLDKKREESQGEGFENELELLETILDGEYMETNVQDDTKKSPGERSESEAIEFKVSQVSSQISNFCEILDDEDIDFELDF